MRNKLIFFASSLGGGGAEMHMLRLANYLSKEHEIIIAVARPYGKYEYKLKSNIRLVYLTKNINSSTLSLIVALFQLRKLIISIKPKSVHSFMEGPNIILLLSIFDRLAKVKTVVNVQVSPLQNYNGIGGKIILLMMRYLYPKAWKVVAISKAVGNEVELICKGKIKCLIVYNIGVTEVEKFEHPKNNQETFKLVACGRLTEQKGFDILLKSIYKLNNKFNLHLTIIGEGPDKHKLENICKKLNLTNVQFTGYLENPIEEFKKHDLFVLSSRWEGFGNVIVEAMSVGIPVLSTNCPHGPNEIITNNVSGKLVPVGDIEALANGIYSLKTDKLLLESIGKGGYQRSLDFTDAKIGSIYNKLLV
ncbi:MAG TPA: glycosyltransferase [Fulvivirga sp.]|nr:glycosyltransferase [Fulvivirga sp.]